MPHVETPHDERCESEWESGAMAFTPCGCQHRIDNPLFYVNGDQVYEILPGENAMCEGMARTMLDESWERTWSPSASTHVSRDVSVRMTLSAILAYTAEIERQHDAQLRTAQRNLQGDPS